MNAYWVAFVWISMALSGLADQHPARHLVALVETLVGAIVLNLPLASEWMPQTEFTAFLRVSGLSC